MQDKPHSRKRKREKEEKKVSEQPKLDDSTTPILFYGRGHLFSNFTPLAFVEDLPSKEKIVWKTREHRYQASKFEFKSPMWERIHKAPTPSTAKRLGRTPGMRNDWNAIRDEVMKETIQLCIKCNPRLKEFLWSTGKRHIAEHTTADLYWGDGGHKGGGQNQLGKILMEIRDSLGSEKT